ncbi:hypothetical protein MTO96_016581 [Rhipicephalus appendiculatus]
MDNWNRGSSPGRATKGRRWNVGDSPGCALLVKQDRFLFLGHRASGRCQRRLWGKDGRPVEMAAGRRSLQPPNFEMVGCQRMESVLVTLECASGFPSWFPQAVDAYVLSRGFS